MEKEFSFEELMIKAQLRENHEAALNDRLMCPESVSGRHNDPDAYGKCNWCNRKIASKRQFVKDPGIRSNLDLAYDYFYNPDGI